MSGQLTLFTGLAGSGKTELAKRLLLHRDDTFFIDKDTHTRSLVEEILVLHGQSPHDRESSTYIEKVRPLEYAMTMKLAMANIVLHKSVFVIAPFIKECFDRNWVSSLQASCSLSGASLKIVWFHSDLEKTRTRLIHRAAKRDHWKLTHWDDYLESIPQGLPELSDPLFFNFDNSVDFDDHTPGHLDALESFVSSN